MELLSTLDEKQLEQFLWYTGLLRETYKRAKALPPDTEITLTAQELVDVVEDALRWREQDMLEAGMGYKRERIGSEEDLARGFEEVRKDIDDVIGDL